MVCKYQNLCGGCPLRGMNEQEYKKYKIEQLQKIVAAIKQDKIALGEPVFIADGCRRRVEMTFQYKKGQIVLGFNAAKSHEIVAIDECLAATEKINKILPKVREFLRRLCEIKVNTKQKNKFISYNISKGEIWLTEVANGVDILLEITEKAELQHRLEICEFVNNTPEAVRISVGEKNKTSETVVEKIKPCVKVGNREVFIPAGTFLQPSEQGQNALIGLVKRYMGETTGKIADLFCGAGTFSYPLAENMQNKITAIDSSAELLQSFRRSVNFLTIPNIKIEQRNLFKYPLNGSELKNFNAVIFDPPRAGAAAQTAQIAAADEADKPQKIIAVSCNPHTFVNDANTLIGGGYELKEMTLVDQFVFAEHFEIAAWFEKI